MVLQGLQDSHPKVRWAACQALGQMCTDLCPELQEEEHARILPALMSLMDDFAHPRVQAHAAAAIVNFTEGGDQVSPLTRLFPRPDIKFDQCGLCLPKANRSRHI